MVKPFLQGDVDVDGFIEKADTLASEFKDFIARGNVVDLAVGTIMGGRGATVRHCNARRKRLT